VCPGTQEKDQSVSNHMQEESAGMFKEPIQV
jgi:hypothetical protein